MGLSLEDLQPKPFIVKLKGHDIPSSPLKLSHALALAKVGEIFKSVQTATVEQLKDAEKSASDVIHELMPDLNGIDLDMNLTVEIMQQLMNNIEPSDNKELTSKGVKFGNDDPKEQAAG